MLDYEDRTTITVVRTDTKAAAEGLNINISDKSGNAATGQTDAGGQLIVPNNQSSTGNENGTIAITAKQNILMLLPLQTKTIPSFPIVKFT